MAINLDGMALAYSNRNDGPAGWLYFRNINPHTTGYRYITCRSRSCSAAATQEYLMPERPVEPIDCAHLFLIFG